jgi:phosphate transport system permease protein
MAAVEPGALAPIDALTTGARLRRRRRVDRMMRLGATGAALLAVVVLAAVIVTVIGHGASQLSISFLTKNPTSSLGATGGGIFNAILGSALLVAVATLMAVPFAVLIAIYLTEFASPRMARPIRLALDMMNGLPSIVIGVFVFGLLVVAHGQSGVAGSFALAVIMVPLITRTTQEMLLLVPKSLRDASYALGVSRWRTVGGIVLPSAAGGIATGVALAVARAAGETAPLILTCSLFTHAASINVFGEPIPNIPVDIFTYSESAFPADHARAWGAALVLIVMILFSNLTAKAILARQRRSAAGR